MKVELKDGVYEVKFEDTNFIRNQIGTEKLVGLKTELLNKIKCLLAGRAAEELMLGEITTGATNDLEVQTI